MTALSMWYLPYLTINIHSLMNNYSFIYHDIKFITIKCYLISIVVNEISMFYAVTRICTSIYIDQVMLYQLLVKAFCSFLKLHCLQEVHHPADRKTLSFTNNVFSSFVNKKLLFFNPKPLFWEDIKNKQTGG